MTSVTISKNSYSIESLYQWDYNQKLEIYGLSMPSTPEVHFAHDSSKLAIVKTATMDAAGVVRADIPNSLLRKANKINAYVCIYEGETFRSLYKIVIPVIGRAQPSDYAGEEEYETYSIEAIDVEVITLEAGADAKVEKKVENDKVSLLFSIPRGIPGERGERGEQGERGEPFTYDDFTDEQLASLTGPAGKDGSSIEKIERTSGNGAPGTTDTYTITLTDGITHTFQVYNGADGSGSGDMTSTVYDPQGKRTDVFQYVDNAIENIDAENITFTDGETFQDKYESGDLTGPAGANGSPGAAGEDGISCTHSWNGTTLTITSASGTSSANLKGDTGATGSVGETGPPGSPATINGVNTIAIVEGENVELSQSGSTLTISVPRIAIINRSTAVNVADANYTTLMARGEKLLDAATFDAVTDWSTELVNGAIAWRYE